ncbi:hypothetical protein GCM10008090_30660 [Arenicella chitinivorans]|uniref:Uncharacterized protein n=1 Tax=Arenicella chitinivorans TaxID=1329800 RepID=A0A918S156_9GAMM|nr:hypothetical protein [Arenicella chitinivorans]GHA18883.1 hypothetical protein GCM10008090_30660 [Arenicella chitinivorans]
MKICNPQIIALIGVASPIVFGGIGFAVRHYLYERENIKVVFEAELTKHPECLKKEFNPHDHYINCRLRLYNLGKKAAHITSITGTGITNNRPKMRVDFYGDDPWEREINQEFNKGEDTSFITEGRSVEEEIASILDTCNGVLQPNSSPMEITWGIEHKGREKIKKQLCVNIYTAENEGGFSIYTDLQNF